MESGNHLKIKGCREAIMASGDGFIHRYVAEISRMRLEKHCRDLKIEMGESVDEIESSGFDTDMSIIMLWSMLGAFVFKIHFNAETAMHFATHGLQVAPDQMTKTVGMDFMREFSNVQAGHLRGVFEGGKVLLGMSLPFLANGNDEQIFKKLRDPRASFSAFKLKCGEFSVVCSTEICVLDHRPLLAIKNILESDMQKASAATAETDGDVQFF